MLPCYHAKLPPYCHPTATLLPPYCHPTATLLLPYCYPTATSAQVLTWYDDDDSGTPYGKGSDLWSLGVLLYVILSGCSPFSADEEELLLKQASGRPPAAHSPLPPPPPSPPLLAAPSAKPQVP